MFFPEKIKGIKEGDRVLEIGPGSLPYPRSDVFLELKIEDEELAKAQRGFAEEVVLDKPVVYYDGKKFPFKDNEFDYVICSHVIEHIPLDMLNTFIEELTRVSKRGYMEFPTIFYEFINYQDVHLSFVNYKNNILYFLDKKIFKSNYIHKIYREMFYCPDEYMTEAFKRYKDFFFMGFEWENKINFTIVNSFEEIINQEDFNKYTKYFNSLNAKMFAKKPYLTRVLLKIKKTICNFIGKL